MGTITFLQRVNKNLVRENVRLRLGDELLACSVETDDNLTFRIESEQLSRHKTRPPRLVELLLRGGESLGLAADLRCEYALAPLESTLEVIHIMEEKYGEFSRLRITFSDDLAAGRDYRGYLHISPAVDFTVEAVGRELIIAGDFRPRENTALSSFRA